MIHNTRVGDNQAEKKVLLQGRDIGIDTDRQRDRRDKYGWGRVTEGS